MTTNSCFWVRRALFAFALFSLAATPALAGGPLFNCPTQPGQPFVWPNGGTNIPYNPDQGGLGFLTNLEAVAQTTAAVGAWEAVSTSTASYVNAGAYPFDIDVTNFAPIYFGQFDGLNPVVYDEDGSIFALLFGPFSGVLGFASPEYGNFSTCEILEGSVWLNGGAMLRGFPLSEYPALQVHEFGHYTNLAHTVVNGQIVLGDTTGPTPNNTFPVVSLVDKIETMYPFLFTGGSGQATPHADDIAILSTLYPEPDFLSTTGTISGTIFNATGSARVTGVNVIARNINDPFDDAVSAISSDFTDSTSQSDPLVGTYTLNGLTPGAEYAVYVDEILFGGFSTPLARPLPGPEEFYNGVDESNNVVSPDEPSDFESVPTVAGSPVTAVDIVFNIPPPGAPLPVGIDGFIELPLPFPFKVCGEDYYSVFVNANGNLTFGGNDFDFTESSGEFLGGKPKIAAVWDDMNNLAGGIVTYDITPSNFTAKWSDVPEFVAFGSNTFEIILRDDNSALGSTTDTGDTSDGTDGVLDLALKQPDEEEARVGSNHIDIIYRDMTVTDGVAGVSCGGTITSGFELASDLSSFAPDRINLQNQPAMFEQFSFSNPNDLANSTVRFNGTSTYNDSWAEPNDSADDARRVKPPFDTTRISKYTEIEPIGGDVDYYEFRARAGQTVEVEVINRSSQDFDRLGGALDTMLGLFDSTGNLLAFDDDGGFGLLSRIAFCAPETGDYFLAVTTFPDFDFDGDGNTGGRYVLDMDTGGTVSDRQLFLFDDDFEEVPLCMSFPFQGQNWASVFVNSNGNLTFGSGDSDFTESVSEFLNERPRIAPLWDDLNPFAGGQILVEYDAGSSTTVRFIDVPEFFNTGANTFSVTMHSDGSVDMTYDGVSSTDSLVGVTEGFGAADPGETDLSAFPSQSVVGTTYEQFTFGDPFDLDNQTVQFLP